MVSVIQRATIQEHDTGESVHVVHGSNSGNLGTEAMSTDRCESDLLLIHEPDNIVAHIVKIERVVVVGISKVAIVEKPHISMVQDSVT